MTLPKTLVLISLDCVRADAIGGRLESQPRTPNLDRFASQATSFTNCCSAATWTIPSHASLFTGLYPWHHGSWGSQPRPISPSAETLSEFLSHSGFRTISLSANPFLSPRWSFTRGFDIALWGDWSSQYLRFLASQAAPRGESQVATAAFLQGRLQGSLRRAGLNFVNVVHAGWPPVWKPLHRLAVGLRREYGLRPPPPSPWVEPALSAWLSTLRADQGAFCFINLMDAHEPYLEPTVEWLARVSSGRDQSILLDGFDRRAREWRQSDPVLLELRARYLRAIERIDSRVGRILSLVSAARGDQDLMVVVTSDHGQTFGEDGNLFHASGTHEYLFHVPLLVRFPSLAGAGSSCVERVSLVDLVPTVRALAQGPSASSTDGEDLQCVVSAGRRKHVLAIADGKSWGDARVDATPSHPGQAGRRLLGFTNETHAVMDEGGRILASPSAAAVGRGESATDLPQSLTAQMAEALRQLVSSQQRSPEDSVMRRLEGWGY